MGKASTSGSVLWVSVFVLGLLASCSESTQPSPEYLQATAAFEKAMAEHPEPDYDHPAYAEVIELYRKVPPTHRVEYKTAENLIREMESKRSNAHRQEAIGARDAQLFENRIRTDRATAQAKTLAHEQCVFGCQSSLRSCLVAAGCTASTGGRARCGLGHNQGQARRCRKIARPCARACVASSEEKAQRAMEALDRESP